MNFKTKNIIYIPTYNHSNTIFKLLSGLKDVNFAFDVLIIDDCSYDDISVEIKKFINTQKHSFNINLVKTKRNNGYAISVKIAFSIFINLTQCNNIIVLHGDGQYDPILINKFEEFLDSKCAIVQGYRDKKSYPKKEQTPIIPYLTIKILNHYENVICKTDFKEWHSGFAMYKRNFISNFSINNLTNTMHIDGNILYISKLLSQKVCSVKIYKKYKKRGNYNYFNMLNYVISVLFFPFNFIIKNKKYYLQKSSYNNFKYDLIDLNK